MQHVVTTLGATTPIVLVLLFLSLLSLALICIKYTQLFFARSGHMRRSAALQSWGKNDKKVAMSQLVHGKSPADRLLRYAMDSTMQHLQRKPLEAELTRRGNLEVQNMCWALRTLELIAMIAPLLGLLGTVFGLIVAFQQVGIAQGNANAALLANGVWQALLTTAIGLIVAIPAAIAQHYFQGRINAAAQDMESAIGEFFLLEDTAMTPAA